MGPWAGLLGLAFGLHAQEDPQALTSPAPSSHSVSQDLAHLSGRGGSKPAPKRHSRRKEGNRMRASGQGEL